MKTLNLADIVYEVYGMDDPLDDTDASCEVLRLRKEFGIIKYNPSADGILNKREAASAFVKIRVCLGGDSGTVKPSLNSRIFTMACMMHYKNAGTPSCFTKDFLNKCDDVYIKCAADGYFGRNQSHQQWVKKALAELTDTQTAFACNLYADIFKLDRDAVKESLIKSAKPHLNAVQGNDGLTHQRKDEADDAPCIPLLKTQDNKVPGRIGFEPSPDVSRPDGSRSTDGRVFDNFFKMSCQIVSCAEFHDCRQLCGTFDDEPPQPGFIGRSYRGLVIVGANPGTGYHRDFYQRNNKEYYALADKFSRSGNIKDYQAYLDFTANYMNYWNQHLCNAEYRSMLGYDIEDVAYLNIVKCRTSKTGSDVFSNCGQEVTAKCAHAYLLKQLEILAPKYIVCHWKPVYAALARLGFPMDDIKCAAFSGARHLTKPERTGEIKPIFDEFKQSVICEGGDL